MAYPAPTPTPIPSALPRLLTPQEQEQQRLLAMAQAQQRQPQAQPVPQASPIGNAVQGYATNKGIQALGSYLSPGGAATSNLAATPAANAAYNAAGMIDSGAPMTLAEPGMAAATEGAGGFGSYAVPALGALAALHGGYGMAQNFGQGNWKGGALSGAETGAGIGTMIAPGVGTAIGAGAGALVGGLTGAIKSGRHWAHDVRSDFRENLKATLPNFLDQGGNVTTVNGGKFNIGIEGEEGRARTAQILSSNPNAQQALSWANPLAQIMTGGDSSIGKSMKGAVGSYLASNLAAAAVSDAETVEGVRANMLNFIGSAGLTREQVHQGIFQLLQAKKITEQEAQVFGHDINVLFDGMSDKYVKGPVTPSAPTPTAMPASVMAQAKPLTPTLPVAQNQSVTPVPKVNLPIRR